MSNELRLGVNIDHVATLRQARHTIYPSPLQAALLAEQAGADDITIHLREDRRHIQLRDVELLRESLTVPMNLELAASAEMFSIAEKIRPAHCCIVPEKRQELTTEGGLDVAGQLPMISQACDRLKNVGIEVSLFIDPVEKQIEAAYEAGAPTIEIHTGQYADCSEHHSQMQLLKQIHHAAILAKKMGMKINAGHGLHYHNVQAIAALPEFHELHIGHAIIAHAVFVGIKTAVREMKQLLLDARRK